MKEPDPRMFLLISIVFIKVRKMKSMQKTEVHVHDQQPPEQIKNSHVFLTIKYERQN